MNFSFEPFRPINTSLYRCDSKFITEPLAELLEADAKFGFIIMDGNGSLYGTVSGNTRSIIHKFSVDLPKKHGEFIAVGEEDEAAVGRSRSFEDRQK